MRLPQISSHFFFFFSLRVLNKVLRLVCELVRAEQVSANPASVEWLQTHGEPCSPRKWTSCVVLLSRPEINTVWDIEVKLVSAYCPLRSASMSEA